MKGRRKQVSLPSFRLFIKAAIAKGGERGVVGIVITRNRRPLTCPSLLL